ncbi:MATE family efflux transporter [Arhodomonas aquaeolei]|uniref:MATE family efflux transporter n=1 Tax=Arhodomonas aquaeolei TaxID=2369 RepID=UPI00036C3333|nr:MATE family efflux transporter [Arhodomonas aquaeolei]
MTPEELHRTGLGRGLFQMTWPMLFGVLSLLGFQLVDSAFIGQLGGRPLAALGFTIPFMQLVIGTQVGIGIATTALVSRALGGGEPERAQRLCGLVVMTGSAIVLALVVILWFLRSWAVSLLGAEPSLLPLIARYWAPWLASAWMGAFLYFGYSVLRAHGNTRLPGLWMVLTSLINLVLDPLFIFVFDWGLPGAAWATLTAFGVGALAVYPALARRQCLRLDVRVLGVLRALGGIAAISGPAMLSQLMPPLSAMLATRVIAGFGVDAVGAWGLGTRMEFFSIVVVLALTMSLPPLVGRLRGAGDIVTIRRLVRLAVGFVLAWQLLLALIWFLASTPLAGVLSADPAVADRLAAYLRLVPWSFGALGVTMIMVSVNNALGLPLRAMITSALRLFACYLPALWGGAQLVGLTGAFAGALAGNLAAGATAVTLYRAGMARLRGPEPASA